MSISSLQSSFSKDNNSSPPSAPASDWLAASTTSDKKVRSVSSSPAPQTKLSKITRLFVAIIALSASRVSAFCAYEGAMCLAPAPICKDSLPRGISIHLTKPQLSTITRAQFNSTYEMGPDLNINDLGGVTTVTPICLAYPGERYAMKMSAHHTDPMIGVQLTSYLLDEGITPHLVRTYEAQNFEYDSSVTVSKRMKNMQFLRMEWLPGDLRNPTQFSVEQRLAFALQWASTLETIKGAFQVGPDAVHLSDLLYHELTEKDCFRGQVMREMDYWKYPVHGQVFYLPRMSYILKIGDYDLWKFRPTNKTPGRFETIYYSMDTIIDKLQQHPLLKGVPKETIKDLLQQWSVVPPKKDSLLDFGIDCLQSAYLVDLPPEPISI